MGIDLSENPTFEEQFERIKSLKEDLDKKEGWTEVMKGEKDCYWMKVFPESIAPMKVLYTFDLELPAKAFGKSDTYSSILLLPFSKSKLQ